MKLGHVEGLQHVFKFEAPSRQYNISKNEWQFQSIILQSTHRFLTGLKQYHVHLMSCRFFIYSNLCGPRAFKVYCKMNLDCLQFLHQSHNSCITMSRALKLYNNLDYGNSRKHIDMQVNAIYYITHEFQLGYDSYSSSMIICNIYWPYY